MWSVCHLSKSWRIHSESSCFPNSKTTLCQLHLKFWLMTKRKKDSSTLCRSLEKHLMTHLSISSANVLNGTLKRDWLQMKVSSTSGLSKAYHQTLSYTIPTTTHISVEITILQAQPKMQIWSTSNRQMPVLSRNINKWKDNSPQGDLCPSQLMEVMANNRLEPVSQLTQKPRGAQRQTAVRALWEATHSTVVAKTRTSSALTRTRTTAAVKADRTKVTIWVPIDLPIVRDKTNRNHNN